MTWKKGFLIAAVILAAAIAGWTGFWFYARHQALTALDGWRSDLEKTGYRISYDTPRFSGYPLSVHARIADASIEAPDGKWGWNGPMVDVRMRPWDPSTYIAALSGQQDFRFKDARGEQKLSFRASESLFRTSLTLAGKLDRLDLQVRDAVLTGIDGNETVIANAAGRFAGKDGSLVPAKGAAVPPTDISIRIKGIKLPETFKSPLGRDVSQLAFHATLNEGIPGAPLREALEQWRKNGGSIDLSWATLDWGPLSAEAGGTIAIDREMRPVLKLKTEFRNLDGTMKVLADAGLVRRDMVKLAEIGVKLMGRVPEGGGPVAVPLPVEINEGQLYLGPIAVASIPPVVPY